jgi:hypothetical protein
VSALAPAAAKGVLDVVLGCLLLLLQCLGQDSWIWLKALWFDELQPLLLPFLHTQLAGARHGRCADGKLDEPLEYSPLAL